MNSPDKLIKSYIDDFFDLEAASGILLIVAATAALIIANSPLAPMYDLLITTPVEVRVGELQILKPLLLWINDGLMAIFFFVVGLELKRELLQGELSKKENIILPAVGAIGGILVPGLIYYALNRDDSVALQGWAIPTATDIAFALGILALLGSRIPTSIKVFLTSLAIFDDVAAIVIIAVFYTANVSMLALLFTVLCLPVLYLLNRNGTTTRLPFIFIGVLMWVAMLKSGVHATLTGVILAFFIPLEKEQGSNTCMLKNLEKDLHGTVAYFILPLFAFVNAGIALGNVNADVILHPVPVGIAMGLFIGKQLGIFSACFLVLKLGMTKLPKDMTLPSLYGTAALCGVGFTMSLFIGSLAFEESGANRVFDDRVGIIAGSLLSGILGYVILRFCYSDSEESSS